MKTLLGLILRSYFGFVTRRSKIYKVFGMRRSGNHAFIKWLSNSLEGTDFDFKTHPDVDYCHFSESGKVVFLNVVNSTPTKSHYSNIVKLTSLLAKCQFLIISEEDVGCNRIDFRLPRRGESIYIHRSVLNLVSSRIRNLQKKAADGLAWPGQTVDQKLLEKLLSWNNLHSGLVWSYDNWLTSEDYRRHFLSLLGLTQDILPGITPQGGGSSFSGLKRPSLLEASKRYEQIDLPRRVLILLSNPRYYDLLNEDEKSFLKNML